MSIISISVFFISKKIKSKSIKNNIKIIKNKNNLEHKLSISKNDNYKNQKIIFYWAKWCGVCKSIKPLWNKTKTQLIKKYPNLKINEIECDDPDKCFYIKDNNKLTIEGVPTILLRMSNSDDIEY